MAADPASTTPRSPAAPRSAPVVLTEPEPHQLRALMDGLNRAAVGLTRHDTLHDPDRARAEIVRGALAVVPAAQCAGLIVVSGDGRITAAAPAGRRAARLDQAQVVLNEGPGVSAADTAVAAGRRTEVQMWVVADTAHPADGGRWPRFAAEAQRHQVHSVLSVRLPDAQPGRQVVVLNLYADRTGAFGPSARGAAALFASPAAVAFHGAERAAELERALASRDVIGQAKGILMERHGVTADEAFARLADASQETNIKLHQVAQWLVGEPRTGRTPTGR